MLYLYTLRIWFIAYLGLHLLMGTYFPSTDAILAKNSSLYLGPEIVEAWLVIIPLPHFTRGLGPGESQEVDLSTALNGQMSNMKRQSSVANCHAKSVLGQQTGSELNSFPPKDFRNLSNMCLIIRASHRYHVISIGELAVLIHGKIRSGVTGG